MRKQHTMIWKRLLALVLALSMFASWLPQRSSAQEVEVVTDNGDLVVEGTNGLGELLSQRLAQAEEEARQAQTQGGCVITDLTVQGNNATVEFVTAEDAMLVVAIYDENQQKLLCSGNAKVTPEETSVQVRIEGEMPVYFRVRAYLADCYDMSPLCQSYETPMYTRAMQELLASSAADYDQDRVLQLEESQDDTNFLVYGENTLRIREEAGVNTVISADDENRIYVFGNADEQLTGLEIGDIFSHEYGDGEILIVKVASLETAGDGTVTITGGELQLDEVFDYIKIEATVDSSDAKVTTPEGGSFTYVDQAPALYGDDDMNVPIGLEHTFEVEYPKEDFPGPDWEEDKKLSITGSISLSITGNLKFYNVRGTDFVELDTDVNFGFYLNVTGSARLPNEPFAEILLFAVPGLTMTLKPTIELSFSGSAEFRATAEWGLGFLWEDGKDAINTCSPFRLQPLGTISATVFIGIDLRPTISLAHSKIFAISAHVPIGVTLEFKLCGTEHDEFDDYNSDTGSQRHDCEVCLDITGAITLTLSIELEFFSHAAGLTKFNITVPLWQFTAYWSITHHSFAFTECPWRTNRLTLQILEKDGSPADGAVVKVDTKPYTANRNGLVTVYIKPGYHVVQVSHNDESMSALVESVRAGKAVIHLGSDTVDFIYGVFSGGEVEEQTKDHGNVRASGTCYGGATWTLYNDGHLAIRGEGSITAPGWSNYVNEFTSVSVGSWVTGSIGFGGCLNLKKVTISSNYITDVYFKNCAALETVKLPYGLTKIRDEAFYGCTSLKEIVIPNSVTTVGHSAFQDCTILQSVQLSAKLKTIGYNAFQNCTSLEAITIPASVTQMEAGIFNGCRSLEVAEIKGRITDINGATFQNCVALTEVILPDSVTAINRAAFSGCSALRTINFPKNLTLIDYEAFLDCTALLALEFGNNLETIGYSAFSGCTALTSVALPNGLASIGAHAFSGCTGLRDVTFGAGPCAVGTYAFSGCTGLENVWSPSLRDWLFLTFDTNIYFSEPLSNPMFYAKHLYLGGKEPVDIVIPENCQVGNCALLNCDTLKSVQLPAGITTLGAYAFYDCDTLPGIELPDSLATIGEAAFADCDALYSIRIPDGVTVISDSLFSGCTALTSAVVSKNAVEIQGSAFFECSALRSIHIPDKVRTIGRSAFAVCNHLSTVLVGNALTSIGYEGFAHCDRMESIIFQGHAPQFDDTTFNFCNTSIRAYYPQNNSSWDNIWKDYGAYSVSWSPIVAAGASTDTVFWFLSQGNVLHVTGFGSTADYARGTAPWYAYRDRIVSLAVGDGFEDRDAVTRLGDYAFADMTALKTVTDGHEMTAIGRGTFAGCTSLDNPSLYITERIGADAFAGCSGMTQVTLPSTLTEIGPEAFRNTGLTYVSIPRGITSLADSTFAGCKKLSAVVLPSEIGTIGNSAFQDCDTLVGVVIPENVTALGRSVFSGCDKLINVTFLGNAPVIGAGAFEGNTLDACYLAADATWTEAVRQSYGGSTTWKAVETLATGTCGDKMTWVLTADGKLLISGTGPMDDINKANEYWNNYKSAIRKVVITEGITSIGIQAFYGCGNLEKITIPKSVTAIGELAFGGCSNLKSIRIPDSVASIGSYAFAYCGALTEVILPSGLISVPKGMFSDCASLVSIALPETVTSLGAYAFSQCAALKQIALPVGITQIGNGTFQWCQALETLQMPGKITSIGDNAFYYCTALTGITLPESVTSIGAEAFAGCDGLTSVNIPAGVTQIGEGAFEYCDNLTTVRAADLESWLGITYGGFGANPMCNGAQLYFGDRLVTDITVPASAGALKEFAFQGCTSLVSVTVESGVTDIGRYVFRNCSNLQTVSIQDTATALGFGIFYGCRNLQTANLPAGLTEIPAYLFYGCASLASITIPATVTAIGEEAFYGCASLKEVVIPEGITTLLFNTFHSCSALESVTLPSTLATVQSQAFWNCEAMDRVNVPSLEFWLGLTFEDSSSNPLNGGAKLYVGGVELTELQIPDNITELGDNQFYGCESLQTLVIPDHVTSLGRYVFRQSGLVSVTIGAGITEIPNHAFYLCENLEAITLSDGLTTLGDRAFFGCAFTQIDLPKTLELIDTNAFYDCRGLTRIDIPASVQTIEYRSFAECRNLTQIVFYGDPPEIDNYAFDRYGEITAYYPAGNAAWTEDLMKDYGGKLTWVPGLPPTEILDLDQNQDAPTLDAVFEGDYQTESTGEKTASFTGLVPGEEYLLLCLVSLDAEDLLAPSNLLYIDQAAALEDGTLFFRYIPRTPVGTCYVMACGPNRGDLSGATVTFPIMSAGEEAQAVQPQVVCDGKLLTEGRDYMVLGQVEYTAPGEYVITIQGIHGYSGAVVCSYTVLAEYCPNNPETGEHNWADATCKEPKTCELCGETQGEKLGHKYENGSCIRCGDADPDYVNPDEPKPTDPAPTEPKPTEPKPTEPKPTEPEVTEPKPTEPKPTEPKPTEPKPTEPEAPKVEGVTRLAGADRLVTSELIADQLKAKLGVEKFQNIIVASGGTFADALPGSYLSAVKNAPILLTLAKDKYVNQTADYIKANLANGGTVYILGGESAVPASMEAALAGIKVQRVAGADRFGTNLAILKEAGVKAGDEILVCTAREFADSLSASATGKPILLVYKKLTAEQKAYLATLSGCKFTVVGGTTAVPDSIAKEVEAYGAVTRLAGKDRLETSTMVAAKYFADAKTTVVAYGWNFPDGLCGGSLAYALDAPLILTHSKTKLYTFTATYTTGAGLKAGYVLGGDGLVDDAATRAIFGMNANGEINILK